MKFNYIMHKKVWPFPSDGELPDDSSSISFNETENGLHVNAHSNFKDLKYCYI